MLLSVVTSSLVSAGILGVSYGVMKHKLQREPFSAIISFFQQKEKNKQLSVALSQKEEELSQKEKSLQERSDFLDQKYDDLVNDDQITQAHFNEYKGMIEEEKRAWNSLQETHPHTGQEAVLQLVKRDATARTSAEGFYKYLHDHRGALMDTQYLTFRSLQGLLTSEFSESKLQPFVVNLFNFLCSNGYNPYLISWILMISLKEI